VYKRQSSRKGTIFGESFYWKINRSMDATAGAEYWSSRGWAQHGEFRARPAEQSYLHATYFGVLDRGFAPARIDQGGQDVKLNLETALPAGFRGVASLNYLSSFVFRLAFTEVFSQAVNSEVKSVAFLSRTRRGYSLNLMGARYQNFQSTAPGDLVLIAHAPSLEFSSVERPLVRSPLYWSLDAAAEGVSRREPLFKTNQLVGRFDVRPRLSLPLFMSGWTVRPELTLHNTYYTQRRLPVSAVGVPGNDTVNRRALETALELRPPTLGRIFAGKLAGRLVKHTIEPRFTYRYVTGIDNFSSIIRFDARDILSDTNEIEYALVNRLFLKRPGASGAASPAQEGASAQDIDSGAKSSPGAQEFISWELAQKYFFSPDFGGAVVVPGKRNVLETTVALTGIAFLTEPRRFSPLVSRLRVRSSANSDLQWQLDYDNKKGRISASSLFVNYHFGDFFVGGSHVLFHSPGELFVTNPIPGPERFHQFRALLGYGGPGKRGLSAAGNVGFDANLGFLQYSAFQTAYNWDCCGVSMEYRRFALGAVRNENQFRFAFTLANIGTFGNLKRQERVF